MNHQTQQMYKFCALIVLFCLVLINLAGAFHRPPTELKTSYWSWRVHTNRLRHNNLHSASEVGPYPNIKNKDNISMVALTKANQIYVLKKNHIVYILNAKINLSGNHRHVAVGELRGSSIYHYSSDGKGVTAHNWLSLGQNADIENVTNREISNTIQLSKKDTNWLYNNLPEGVKMTIY